MTRDDSRPARDAAARWRHRGRFLAASWVAIVMLAASSVAAQERVTPATVHSNVRALQAELELIRAHLGREADARPAINVRGAAPREVYFAARSLATRSSRLAFEHLRRRYPLPDVVPADKVEPSDVLALVSNARADAGRLLDHFGLDAQVEVPAPNPDHKPTDVFRAIVQANRQLNLLMVEPFTPSDVWMQVTLAVSHAAGLLSIFEAHGRIPVEPAFEPTRRPRDVYRRLLGCFEHIRKIAKRSNQQVLELEVSEAEFATIVPSDVYDLASLVVAELAFLVSLNPNLAPPVVPYRPDQLKPPHVYQRVGMLEEQLERLGALVNASPQWLRP